MNTKCKNKTFALLLIALCAVLAVAFAAPAYKKGDAASACTESGTHLESFEEGWNQGRQATGEGQFKEGTGSLEFPGLGVVDVKKVFTSPLDMSGCDMLTFWLYVDNVTVFNSMADGQFELRPTDASTDSDEIHWSLKNIPGLKNGWNYVKFDFASADKAGSAEFNSIGMIRFYFVGLSGDSITVRFDDLHANRTKGTQLFNFETPVGGFTQVMTGEGEFKEGTGSLNMSGDGFVDAKALNAAVDISMYDGIALWIYSGNASTVSQLNDFELEIVEGTGRDDAKEYSWNIKSSQLKVGWSRVLLKFADAKDKLADLTKIQAIGFVKPGVSGIQVYLDDLRAVETKFFEEDAPAIEKVMAVNADKVISGVFDGMTLDYTGHKEGVACLQKDLTANAVFNAAVNIGKTSLNISGDTDLLGVTMWVYVSDTSKITSSVFELSSSGSRDVLELQWNLSGLQDGWNWVTLSASAADKTGIIDTDAIMRMTYDFKVSGNVTVKFDRISVVNLDVAGITAEPPASEKITLNPIDSLIVSACDSSGSGTFDGSDIEMKDHKQGKGAVILANAPLSAAKSFAANISVGKTDLMAKECTSVNALALQFWLYVGDVTKVSKIDVEISSGAGADNALSCGAADGLTLVNGWNWVVLKASDANCTVGNTFDADNITAFKLNLAPANTTDAVKVIIDRITIANGAKAANNAVPPASEKIILNPINSKIIVDCDSIDSQTFQGNQLDKGDQRQGLACVKTSGAGYGLDAKNIEVGKTDLTKNTLVFAMWIWVEDVTFFRNEKVNGQIELASDSTGYDKSELNWEKQFWITEDTVNGWNWIVLYGKDASVSGGEPDYDHLSRFRIYVNNIAMSTFKLDRLTLTNINDAAGIAMPDWESETSSSGEFQGPNGSLGSNDTFLDTEIVGEDFIETIIEKTGCKGKASASEALLMTALAACFAVVLKIRR